MTCELRLLAKISNVNIWKKYLFASEKDDFNWLQKCIVAVSPVGDKILVGHSSALVLLQLQWDKDCYEKSSPEMIVQHQWDSVEDLKLQDLITSAVFLPIAPSDSHSHGYPDWTCIAVGFSSGCIRFFTENMDLIAEDRLQPEPLLYIRVNSPNDITKDSKQLTETIYAVYPSVVCSIPCFSLLQTLRNRRKEAAICRARSHKLVPQITLEAKKLDLPVQPIRDACFVSPGATNQFDHLLKVSLTEGFYANYRPSPLQHSVIASTGAHTWLQFQNTTEGVAVPFELTDVAVQVMNKLPGWLGLGSQTKNQTVVRASEKLVPKSRLLDRRRDGRALFPSPDGSLLAVTDSLGRVTLVDVRTSTAIRMWKGYRDAECGYLEVEEEVPKSRHRHRHENTSTSKTPRKVLLLVIYGPKKGFIEIFPLRHGPRVAALSVGKNGRLVYTPYGFIGQNALPKKSNRPNLVSLSFLSDGSFMDIIVPYYCAVLDSSVRAKDLHQLKKFKQWVKETERSEDDLLVELKTMCEKLETDDARLHAIDYLCSAKYVTPQALISVLEIFLEKVSDNDINETSGHQRNLLTLCKHLRNFVNFYIFLQNLEKMPDETIIVEDESLSDALILSESEVSIFREFVKNMQSIHGPKREVKVTFSANTNKKSLPHFLESLDFSEMRSICAKPVLQDEDYKKFGELLFSRLSFLPSQLESWKIQAKRSNLDLELMSRSLVVFWLQKPILNIDQDIRIFLLLFKTVLSISDAVVASSEYSIESPWWTEIRGIISQSNRALNALVIAVCCRSVSIQCEQTLELQRVSKSKNQPVAESDWENVSADTWQWDLLITRLEDVALLNTVLSMKPTQKGSVENSEISLNALISAGDEAVSEKVAKWLIQFKIPPNLLVNKTDVEFQTSFDDALKRDKANKLFKGDEILVLPLIEIAEEAQPESETEKVVLEHINLLKKRFPYSLTCSSLLSYLAWELMSSWQSNISNVDLLQSAIEHIKVIPSSHLKIGICVLAWAAHVKVHFEAVVRFMSKAGKLPTHTLCMSQLNMPRNEIVPFLESTLLLLTTILDHCAERPQIKFILKHETLWRESGTGLISVAIARPPPSEDMVMLHEQVNTFFHMVAALELREKHLSGSFLDSLKPDLFGELTQTPITSLHNTGLIKNLTKILCHAVSSSVQTILEVETENGSTRLDSDACSQWLRKCFSLASAWRIPINVLRIQHVCELYSCGFDRLAEEALQNVSDPQMLNSSLLVIVGNRINALIASDPYPEKILANFSPSLTSWLKTLKNEVKETRVDLNDLELLVSRILNSTSEDSIADKQLALLIAENLAGLEKR